MCETQLTCLRHVVSFFFRINPNEKYTWWPHSVQVNRRTRTTQTAICKKVQSSMTDRGSHRRQLPFWLIIFITSRKMRKIVMYYRIEGYGFEYLEPCPEVPLWLNMSSGMSPSMSQPLRNLLNNGVVSSSLSPGLLRSNVMTRWVESPSWWKGWLSLLPGLSNVVHWH